MNMETTFPPAPPGRLAQFIRMVGAFERDEIETAVDLLITHLDETDGDPDTEDDDRAALTMRAPGEDFDFEDEPLVADHLPGVPEDAEDDDPAGGDIVDENHDDEHDREADNCDLEEGPDWKHDVDDADRFTRTPHRDRIRRTRCAPKYERYRDHRTGQPVKITSGWTLRFDPLPPSRTSLLRRKRGLPRFPRP